MRNLNKLWNNPIFYGIAGILSMILVIGVARTSLFQLCYLPLLLAAKFTSSESIPEIGQNYPPKIVRVITFVFGMIFTEIAFSLILIIQKELSFDISAQESGWTVIAIELLQGIAVYLVFFGIAALLRYLVRKLNQPKQK